MKKTVKSLLVIFFFIALLSITLLSVSAATDNTSSNLVHGDASGDGVINSRDVLMARQYMANYNYKTGTSSIAVSEATDVSGDAKINALDVLMISKYLANYDYDTNTSTVEFKHSVEPAVAPTCTKWGATQGEFCTICNLSFSPQEFLSPTGHNYINKVCSVCGDTQKDYSDISLYKLNESDAFFKSIDNGEAMKALYDEMEKELSAFHTGTTDAKYNTVNDILGEVYTVGVFNYAEYGLSLDEAATVYALFRKDHPVFYWLPYILYKRGSEKIVVVTVKEYASGADRSNYNEIVYKGIEEYAKLVDGETNKYNIALTYYDAIMKNNVYAYNDAGEPETALWAHSIIGDFLYGEVVCEGYARLYHLLLSLSGIESMYVSGAAGGGNHGWNLAQLDDGNWYWFDATWGDGSGNPYRYFCVTDSFLNTHTPVSSNQLGSRPNATLPQRASSPYANDEILEIGEGFIVGKRWFVLSSSKTVKLKSGPLVESDKLLYRGVVYDVVK